MKKTIAIAACLVPMTLFVTRMAGQSPPSSSVNAAPAPVTLTAEQDHRRMMDLLHITSLRPGANPNDPKAPNAVNTDEAKANPYSSLPDPLTLKNGRKVTSAAVWRNRQRAEIMEDFDREVYGRVPKNTPKVTWTVTSTTPGTNGDIPTVTKELVGHVDNSAYPALNVAIQATLTTPANATGRVPVIVEFGFVLAEAMVCVPILPVEMRERAPAHRPAASPLQIGSDRFWQRAGAMPF